MRVSNLQVRPLVLRSTTFMLASALFFSAAASGQQRISLAGYWERWIAGQMKGRTCAVVLVGAETASRPWVKYEIKKAWSDGLGVVGIRIHGLKNRLGNTTFAGANPFDSFSVDGTAMSQIVALHIPTGNDSQAIYSNIHDKLDSLVESAIKTRAKY